MYGSLGESNRDIEICYKAASAINRCALSGGQDSRNLSV